MKMKICRMTILKIFLGMWLFLEAKGEEELVCDILGACDNQYPGTKIEDPSDCHKYYICITTTEGDVVISDAAMPCPAGYYFNDEQQDCLVEDYKCRNKCDNLFCSRSCDNVPDGTRIAYPDDCSKFRVCAQDSEPVVGECSSETPYFNGTSCSNDVNSCCDICTPYCEVAYTEVEDPFDCHSFYLCQWDDYIPESEHFTCESGKYYSVAEGDCVDSNGTTCNSVCKWYTTTVLTTGTTEWIYTTQASTFISTNQNFTTRILPTNRPTFKPISTSKPLTSTLLSSERQSRSEVPDLPSETSFNNVAKSVKGRETIPSSGFVQKEPKKSESFQSLLDLLTRH
ncbi:UNVERIFIED_CONTAM: hypothetical protein RMT77_010373 [Armadillidium vulgare]